MDSFAVWTESRSDVIVRSRLRGWRATGSKPDSSEDPSCIWSVARLSYVVAKRHTVGAVRLSRGCQLRCLIACFLYLFQQEVTSDSNFSNVRDYFRHQ
ncbi:hypothetical protein AVEN_126503-1 [Araneus ventricosus]|uniref:Uncharacterized protein n=1 Tax=Araneus ventricosus TaxID=182803 RepID=A0A4Y2JAV6_ARAVE|nr:hypothetical protein AVEN_153529-1 [Araneus ventricosus]GBN30758.1 hypothetical protein AVEN_126503-1 [Araneus ventricosus]